MVNATAIVLIATWLFWRGRVGKNRLRHVLESRGHEIIDIEYRVIRRGPFLLHVGIEPVFFFVVKGNTDLHHTGFAKLGHALWGMLSDKVEFAGHPPKIED